MGKAIRWFKSLLGVKTPPKTSTNNDDKANQKLDLKRWNLSHSNKEMIEKMEKNKWFRGGEVENEQSKHAIAVAAATAAAADAALVAAQAAVAVVRLTSQSQSQGRGQDRGSIFSGGRDIWAAVRIQSFFRGYLARRAHRALKGLVKLQAHVRGYLVRKQAATTLHCMQALVRAQVTVRSQRASHQALTKNNKSPPEFRPRKSTERFDEPKNDQLHSRRLSTSYEPCNYEGSPKIVEIDTFKPRSRSRRVNNPSMYEFGHDDFQYPTMSSPLPCPVPSRLSIPECQNDWSFYGYEYRVCTAQNTPRFTNFNRSVGPLTPTKSVCGDGLLVRSHSSHPSYMGDTQSFRAKLRSHSAPKQRPEGRSKKGLSLEDIMAARNSISGVRMHRSCSQVQESLDF